jgi:hypothetical protein
VPDTVSADAGGWFAYEMIFHVGPGSALLAALGWDGVENASPSVVVDCFCDPELCFLEEGDSDTTSVWGYLVDAEQAGVVETWVTECGFRGSAAASTVIVPYATPAPAVPSAAVTDLRVHPNPFRSTVRLTVDLDRAARAVVEVLDVRGRVIRRLLDDGLPEGRTSSLSWSGRDHAGSPVAAGIYFVRLAAGDTTLVRKVVHLGPSD